jgi:hypothetical protein
MNTFHNFTTCIYTAQGKVVCQKKDKKTNVPLLLESFVNTIPNQKGNDCNTSSTNSDNKCSFNFDCTNKSS